jgi:hypothetical protein
VQQFLLVDIFGIEPKSTSLDRWRLPEMHSHAERCPATKYVRLECTDKGSTPRSNMPWLLDLNLLLEFVCIAQYQIVAVSNLPVVVGNSFELLNRGVFPISLVSQFDAPNSLISSYSLLVVPLNILKHVNTNSHRLYIKVSTLKYSSLPKIHTAMLTAFLRPNGTIHNVSMTFFRDTLITSFVMLAPEFLNLPR